KKGQPLVRFDARPFELAIEEAEAALAEAEVRYRDNIVPESLVTKRAPSEEIRRNALARAGIPSAKVRVEKAKFEREKATALAPCDGAVDRVDIANGERVSTGEALMNVVDLNNLRIEAAVLEHDLPLIKVGGQAIVTSAAAPDRQSIGRVTAVLPLVDST